MNWQIDHTFEKPEGIWHTISHDLEYCPNCDHCKALAQVEPESKD